MKRYEVSFDMKVKVYAKNKKEAKKIAAKRIKRFLQLAQDKKI